MKAFVFVLLGVLLLVSTPAMAQTLVPYEIQPPTPLFEKTRPEKPFPAESSTAKYEVRNEWKEDDAKFQVRLDNGWAVGEIETADPLHRRRGQPGPGDTIGFEWKERR